MLTVRNFLWILVRLCGQMNCWMLKSWGIYCSAEQASRAVNISRTSRLHGVSCCSSNVVSTYALRIILTNNYSNQQFHTKRLKIIQNIKFLHVSEPGRQLQGIQNKNACGYQHNILGIRIGKY